MSKTIFRNLKSWFNKQNTNLMVQTDSTHSLQMSDVGGNLLIRSPNKSNLCELSTKFTHERNLLFGIYYLYPLQRGAGGTGTGGRCILSGHKTIMCSFGCLV